MVRHLALLIGAAAVVGGGLAAIHFGAPPAEPPTDDVVPASVLRTAVVPTLDTPIPDGKSAVWCASFQIAWDTLRTNVLGGEPVEITNAADVCGRLNKAMFPGDALPPDGYYAAAGFEGDGIRDTIAAEMARRFPDAAKPNLTPSSYPDGLHAFGYLVAAVRFTRTYYVNPEPFAFQAPDGKRRTVHSFGLPRVKGLNIGRETGNQPGVLFYEQDENGGGAEFAVDLDRDSKSIQVVLARIDRRRSLAETLARVDERTRSFAALVTKSEHVWEQWIGHDEPLLVPDMNWRIHHTFPELMGPDKALKINGGFQRVVDCEQTVWFHLDRAGAGVESSAYMKTESKRGLEPRRFEFDRPFLLYLKKRGAGQPFFVLWVENADLLCLAGL